MIPQNTMRDITKNEITIKQSFKDLNNINT